MLVTAVCVLFTALLASADGSSSHKPVARAAEITDVGGELSSFENAEVPSGASSLSKRATYAGCSTEQENKIGSAVKEVREYAIAANLHLVVHPTGSPLYTRWFGGITLRSYNNAMTSSYKLAKLPRNWEYRCQSECPANVHLAWVDIAHAGIFNICPKLWTSPSVHNSNLLAFTIMQQGVRFKEVISAEPHVSGYGNATKLAAESPSWARVNADNHAYFILGAHGEKLEKNAKKGSKFRLPAKLRPDTRIN